MSEILREIIQDALGEMNPKDAKIVTLYLLEGYSISDIAVKLGISTKTVRRHLHSALEPLASDIFQKTYEHKSDQTDRRRS